MLKHLNNKNIIYFNILTLGMFVLCTRTKVKFHLVVDRSNEEKRYSRLTEATKA